MWACPICTAHNPFPEKLAYGEYCKVCDTMSRVETMVENIVQIDETTEVTASVISKKAEDSSDSEDESSLVGGAGVATVESVELAAGSGAATTATVTAPAGGTSAMMAATGGVGGGPDLGGPTVAVQPGRGVIGAGG